MLAVIIFVTVFLIRRIVENIWPWLKKQHDENSPSITYLNARARWWNTVILTMLPVLFGAASSFMKSDFFFDGIGDKGGRIAFGGCVGWFAGFLYQALKGLVKQKMGLTINPAADEDE